MKPLTVQILTKEPIVSADKKYEVECRTSGSKPDAVITWYKGNKQIVPNKNKKVSNKDFKFEIFKFIILT